MADIAETVKDTISKLEARVAHLEAKLSGHSGAEDGMRMILIGPPGAGTLARSLVVKPSLTIHRQGNTSSEDQGEVLDLPSGAFSAFSKRPVEPLLTEAPGHR